MKVNEIVSKIKDGNIKTITVSNDAPKEVIIENKKTVLDSVTFHKVHKEYTK